MSDKTYFMALGDFRFSQEGASYEQLQRQINYRWQKLATVSNRPGYQFIGVDDERLEVSGAVFNYQANKSVDSVQSVGNDPLVLMRDQAAKGVPLRLVLDNGKNLGLWLIKTVSEQQTAFVGSAPFKQAYRMTLLYFGARL